MAWGRWPLVRSDELAMCRRNNIRLRLDRGKFAAASRSFRRLGGRTVHFSVTLAFAALFGASRIVDGCPARILRVWSSDRAWCLRNGWRERPLTFGWTGAPPTCARREGFGRTGERVQRGWIDHLGRGEQPRVIPHGLSRVSFFGRSAPEIDGRRFNNDDRFVGCWAGSVGCRDPGKRSRNAAFGWQASSNGFVFVRRAVNSLDLVPGSRLSVLGALKGAGTSGGCPGTERPGSAGR
jgi:hypothetical protein